MERIEELKAQAKELEFNKKQMEKRLKETTQKIEELKSYQYYLNVYGGITLVPKFFDEKSVKRMKQQGNFFETAEEAEKESKKRDLKNEIKEFARGCNGDWKADFEDSNPKHCIVLKENELFTLKATVIDYFPEFGYFRNLKDCERAKEIFGARILELYAD